MKTAMHAVKPPAALKPWTSFVSAAALAVPLGVLHHSEDAGYRPVAFLFTGSAFADRPIITGGALDQPSLHKELFIFCYSLGIVCPFLALVRSINGPSSSLVRSIFARLSLVLLVHPLSVLTIFAYDVSRYILVMGVTPKRLLGLSLAVIGYLVMLRLAVWINGLQKEHDT
jgi:hypothetical protein